MISYRLSLFFILICAAIRSSAQDGMVDLTKNFAFRDGVYLSFEAFRNNRPELSWEEVQADKFTNPQTLVTHIYQLQTDTGALNPELIWGICLQGAPAIRVSDAVAKTGSSYYAPLMWRGKICYYYYNREIEKEIEMSAYNPLTGKPFRTAKIKRKVTELVEKMLHFERGETAVFNVKNFKAWIAHDEDMLARIDQMSDERADEELLQLLKDYSDRNVVFIKE